jgi:hypothetical protein
MIQKHFNRTIKKEYFFIEGKIEIDSDYFIEKIKQGFDEKEAMSYKTNIKGKMTSWKYFNNDVNFLKIANYFISIMDKDYNFPKYFLQDSWGYCVDKYEDTAFHEHRSIFSGVLYLNDADQTLNFPEIKQSVKPEKGKFALFSPFLNHGCKVNQGDKKWGISFNFDTQQFS